MIPKREVRIERKPVMAVLSPLQTNPIPPIFTQPSANPPHHLSSASASAARRSCRKPNGGHLLVQAYMEDSNTLSGLANKILGSLPVIGLVARIISDEDDVSGDIIDFTESRWRVGNKCSINESELSSSPKIDEARCAGVPLYVFLCYWLATVVAGLDKSEEILEELARLRISNDIEFEEENFIAMIK